MANQKRAAINVDEIAAKPLGEVTAADFLAVLEARGIGSAGLQHWPEKKKVELWQEPEHHANITVSDFVRVIGEKKKVELEGPIQYKPLPSEYMKAISAEFPIPIKESREFVDELVEKITKQVVQQLKAAPVGVPR